MNKYEIIKRIENFAPCESAETWDCSGFIAETGRQEVSKIMLCLTPTEEVINQAIAQNCDMIISHHPMFYVDFSSTLITDEYTPRIDMYCAHTNMDKADGGTTDTLIKVLGLENYKKTVEHDFLRMIELPAPEQPEIFAGRLKTVSPDLRYVNNKNIAKVSKVMFCAGSGADFIEEAQKLGGDCLVTGDLKFHTALDSGIVVFDIGHFESEILILPVFASIIGKGVEIVFAKEKSPFIKL